LNSLYDHSMRQIRATSGGGAEGGFKGGASVSFKEISRKA